MINTLLDVNYVLTAPGLDVTDCEDECGCFYGTKRMRLAFKLFNRMNEVMCSGAMMTWTKTQQDRYCDAFKRLADFVTPEEEEDPEVVYNERLADYLN